jgi:hypothetical protein
MSHTGQFAVYITSVLALVACSAAEPDRARREAPAPVNGQEHVTRGPAAPRVTTDQLDALGRPVTVACATCHSLSAISSAGRRVSQPPTAFHQDLVVEHGARADLRCDSCHAGPDYGALKTADGRRLDYTEVNGLCRQCHGTQARDFDHGAHGGMQGHWDLSFGDRQRHACTTCHDPHAPKFAPMWPARPPGDVRWRGDQKKPVRREAQADPATPVRWEAQADPATPVRGDAEADPAHAAEPKPH